jgi:hypothetical protein
MRAWLVILAAAGLAGCMPVPSAEAVNGTFKQEAAGCVNLPTHVATAGCINEAINRTVAKTFGPNVPDADLLRLGNAERLVVAEKMDGGQMTPAEANAVMARVGAETNSEAQRRLTNMAIALDATRPY